MANMADVSSTDIPWGSIVVTVLGAVIAAGGTVFGFLFRDRVKASEAERDRAIMACEKERVEKEEFKSLFKKSVESHRRTRRDVEETEQGRASIHPASPEQDQTGSYVINYEIDEAWQRDRELEKERARQDRMLEKYNRGESLGDTPPQGHRARQKSFHGKR